MSVDWRRLTREAKLQLHEDAIEVKFDDDRRHAVYVEVPQEATLRLWSIVAKPGTLRSIDNVNLRAWSRNRVTDLVGFKVDRRGRLIGEAWVPVAGLNADEWGFYVRTVARACDRFEYILTGRDLE